MEETDIQTRTGERIRVLRVAHASLTPALRERERALVKVYPDIDLEVLTTLRWHEAGVYVEATDDDLFPVTRSRSYLSNHIQLFAYDPRTLIATLRRHRPHLIDMNHEPYSIACAEVLAICDFLTPGVPVVMQVAQNIPHRYPPPISWLQRRALRRVSAAYACSEESRELLRAKGFDKPVAIVPFGVNTEAFAYRRAGTRIDHALTIGFVGRMLPGKGLGVLADALPRIANENWKLLVVGEGPERKRFEQALVERSLIDRAEFVGAVPYEEVPDYYHRMDMLVMPTRTTKRIREQFGRVLVEAMSSGVPVLGTTCGAIPEVLASAGMIVAEDDAAAMGEALRQLLRDETLRERLAKAGRARVERHYSWEQVARKTYSLFQQVLRGKAATGVSHHVEVAA